ncbi:MAG TPA: response regulator transcription factor [Chitinophagales bacterium]|nr:response regulator transcription factor [Chitinophagales bacterium]
MQAEKARILLAEDDRSLASVIRDYLSISGYQVTLCEDGQAAMNIFKNSKFDLCILDVMMPKKDGYAVAEEIRKTEEAMPILFLTSKSAKEDRIRGFKSGGDDFITKPFNIEELVLRMEVFLKRSKANHAKQKTFQLGSLIFDYTNFELLEKKESVVPKGRGKVQETGTATRKLTEKEAEILYALCCSLHNVVKRDDLLMKVWGSDDYFLGRSLDVFISKLRKYLAVDPSVEIENHHGVGFRLVVKGG